MINHLYFKSRIRRLLFEMTLWHYYSRLPYKFNIIFAMFSGAFMIWKGSPMSSMWTKPRHTAFRIFKKLGYIIQYLCKGAFSPQKLANFAFFANDVQHDCKYVLDSWRLWLHENGVKFLACQHFFFCYFDLSNKQSNLFFQKQNFFFCLRVHCLLKIFK